MSDEKDKRKASLTDQEMTQSGKGMTRRDFLRSTGMVAGTVAFERKGRSNRQISVYTLEEKAM